MVKSKWFIYTLLVGFIPIIIRILAFIAFRKATTSFIVSAGDLVSLGLVLNLGNINELDANKALDENWKKWQIGISVLSITVYGFLYGVTILSDGLINAKDIDTNNIKIMVAILCFISTIFSYSIFNRLNKVNQ